MKHDTNHSRRSFLRLDKKSVDFPQSDKVKMLTSDGHLVWVDKSQIKKGGSKTTNQDILDWRDPTPNNHKS